MVKDRVLIHIGQRSLTVEKGANLMESLVAAGVMLRADCGGRGRCGKCMIQVDSHDRSPVSLPNEAERRFLGEDGLKAGWRLCCCVRVFDTLTVTIPHESLLDAEVVQKSLPPRLSRHHPPPGKKWPAAHFSYGLAVDLGTTTIAVHLCDLSSFSVLGSTSVRNPQGIFGEDVIGRIVAAGSANDVLRRLQAMAVRAIEWAASAICRRLRIDPAQIRSAVVVGNSTMIHLLLGEDPSSIGVFPYTPVFTSEQTRRGMEIGFNLSPRTHFRTLPLISGFLGADLVAAALAADLPSFPPGTLLVDVGTNGELILVTEKEFAATSCATGPAFEGAAIRHGMPASSGAIDSVRFNDQAKRLEWTLIQQDPAAPQPPSGLCGSGVIGTVAELLRIGAICKNGRFNMDFDSPCLVPAEGTMAFEIVSAASSRDGRPILLTQADVRAVQLAKGALRAGIELLCRQYDFPRPSRILLAGAFGSSLRKADVLTIGMFPDLPEEDIEVVGNAAGAGAVLALRDEAFFQAARDLTKRIVVFDLAAHPDFQDTFIRHLSF